VEEYLMLRYCRNDLLHAFKQGKINAEGMKLIRQIYREVDSFGPLVNSLKLSPKLKKLERDLENKRQKYQLTKI
jgi:hypothetical protein